MPNIKPSITRDTITTTSNNQAQMSNEIISFKLGGPMIIITIIQIGFIGSNGHNILQQVAHRKSCSGGRASSPPQLQRGELPAVTTQRGRR
jgi:hypothetical protein